MNNNEPKFEYADKKRVLTQEELDYLDNKRQEWIEREYRYFDFADNNALAYDLKKGEIYEIDWGMNINAEFSGRHYGVVLCDSGKENPLVLVCPLKSNHKKKINPKSDVYIGSIDGLPKASETIAVINQIKAIDKMRIYTTLAIGPKRVNYRLEQNDNRELQIFRLDNDKVQRIVSSAAKMLFGLNKTKGQTDMSGGND